MNNLQQSNSQIIPTFNCVLPQSFADLFVSFPERYYRWRWDSRI